MTIFERIPRVLYKAFRDIAVRMNTPRGALIMQYTREVEPYVEGFLGNGKPVTVVWFDERSEPYAAATFLRLYSADKNVRHIRIDEITGDMPHGSRIIAVDHVEDYGHIEELKRTADAVRELFNVESVHYMTVKPVQMATIYTKPEESDPERKEQ